MKIIIRYSVILVIAILLNGCFCWMVPCDRQVHVSGKVINLEGDPVQGATVEFYGVKKTTDENGCFYFGGILAAPGFNVEITKDGFKNYKEGRQFDFYHITVLLASTDSKEESSAEWHKIKAEELSKYETCKK